MQKRIIAGIVAGVSLIATELTVLRLLPQQGEQATAKNLEEKSRWWHKEAIPYSTIYAKLRSLKRLGLVKRRGKRVFVSGLPAWRVFWEAKVRLTWSDPNEPKPQ